LVPVGGAHASSRFTVSRRRFVPLAGDLKKPESFARHSPVQAVDHVDGREVRGWRGRGDRVAQGGVVGAAAQEGTQVVPARREQAGVELVGTGADARTPPGTEPSLVQTGMGAADPVDSERGTALAASAMSCDLP
jgi:hypothetical protein